MVKDSVLRKVPHTHRTSLAAKGAASRAISSFALVHTKIRELSFKEKEEAEDTVDKEMGGLSKSFSRARSSSSMKQRSIAGKDSLQSSIKGGGGRRSSRVCPVKFAVDAVASDDVPDPRKQYSSLEHGSKEAAASPMPPAGLVNDPAVADVPDPRKPSSTSFGHISTDVV